MKLKYFTEKTLEVAGWYFFYPKHEGYEAGGGYPQFMQVNQVEIEENWLHCKKYAGTYIGPYEVPSKEEPAFVL